MPRVTLTMEAQAVCRSGDWLLHNQQTARLMEPKCGAFIKSLLYIYVNFFIVCMYAMLSAALVHCVAKSLDGRCWSSARWYEVYGVCRTIRWLRMKCQKSVTTCRKIFDISTQRRTAPVASAVPSWQLLSRDIIFCTIHITIYPLLLLPTFITHLRPLCFCFGFFGFSIFQTSLSGVLLKRSSRGLISKVRKCIYHTWFGIQLPRTASFAYVCAR